MVKIGVANVAVIADSAVEEMEPVLYRFALRATRDPELSRDLTQDALLAVVAQRAAFAGRSTLRTWAVGILSNKIADHFRRQANCPIDSTDDPELLAEPSPADLERALAARQKLAVVLRALEKIPEFERLALMMVDVEGVEREDSCSALGISATHLRVLLHRGRNRLRRAIEQDWT